MPQWKQIIFEHNTIVGISPIAGGQSLGTGPGGGGRSTYTTRTTASVSCGATTARS